MSENLQLADRILDQAADALIYPDRTGSIARWNSAAAALFGSSPEEALGQNLDLIIPEHLRAAHWRGCTVSPQRSHLKVLDATAGMAPRT